MFVVSQLSHNLKLVTQASLAQADEAFAAWIISHLISDSCCGPGTQQVSCYNSEHQELNEIDLVNRIVYPMTQYDPMLIELYWHQRHWNKKRETMWNCYGIWTQMASQQVQWYAVNFKVCKIILDNMYNYIYIELCILYRSTTCMSMVRDIDTIDIISIDIYLAMYIYNYIYIYVLYTLLYCMYLYVILWCSFILVWATWDDPHSTRKKTLSSAMDINIIHPSSFRFNTHLLLNLRSSTSCTMLNHVAQQTLRILPLRIAFTLLSRCTWFTSNACHVSRKWRTLENCRRRNDLDIASPIVADPLLKLPGTNWMQPHKKGSHKKIQDRDLNVGMQRKSFALRFCLDARVCRIPAE